MACECGSNKLLMLSGKCSDMAFTEFGEVASKDGYVPYIDGLGGGDYIDLTICIDCRRVQDFTATEQEIIQAIKGDE